MVTPTSFLINYSWFCHSKWTFGNYWRWNVIISVDRKSEIFPTKGCLRFLKFCLISFVLWTAADMDHSKPSHHTLRFRCGASLLFHFSYQHFLDKFRNISRFFGQIGTFALFHKNELVWRDDGRWKAKFKLSNKTKDWIFIIRKSRVKWRTWGQNITIRFQWHGMDKKITHGFLTKDKNFNKSIKT